MVTASWGLHGSGPRAPHGGVEAASQKAAWVAGPGNHPGWPWLGSWKAGVR